MREITVATTQMSCSADRDDNVARATSMVRRARAAGADLVLLQELFETRYFGLDQDARHFALAHDVQDSPLLAH